MEYRIRTRQIHEEELLSRSIFRFWTAGDVGQTRRRRLRRLVIIALHGLREKLDHPYRRLQEILYEIPGVVKKPDLTIAEFPDIATIYTQTLDLMVAGWQVLPRLSAALHELGEVRATDASDR